METGASGSVANKLANSLPGSGGIRHRDFRSANSETIANCRRKCAVASGSSGSWAIQPD